MDDFKQKERGLWLRLLRWLMHEARAILTAMLFFLACFAVIVVLKDLLLEEYDVTVGTPFKVVLLSLVTAKVVVAFERVSFGRQIGLVEVLLRSAVYSLAAFLSLLLEHALSESRAAGGFVKALTQAFQHPDMPAIWGTLICVTLAFVVWTVLAVLRREFGRGRLLAAFLERPRATDEAARH